MSLIKFIMEALSEGEVLSITVNRTKEGKACVCVVKAGPSVSAPLTFVGEAESVDASLLAMFSKTKTVPGKVEVVKDAPKEATKVEAPVPAETKKEAPAKDAPAQAAPQTTKETPAPAEGADNKAKANEHYKKGVAAFRSGDFKKALDFFQLSREFASPEQRVQIDKSIANCQNHIGEELFKESAS